MDIINTGVRVERQIQSDPLTPPHADAAFHAAYYVFKAVEHIHLRLNAPVPSGLEAAVPLTPHTPQFASLDFAETFGDSVFRYEAIYDHPHRVSLYFRLVHNSIDLAFGTVLVYDSRESFEADLVADIDYLPVESSRIHLVRFGNLNTLLDHPPDDEWDRTSTQLLATHL